MIFYPDLFLTDSTKKEYKKLIPRLKKEIRDIDVFLVTLSTDISGVFDIVDYKTMFLSVGNIELLKDLVVIGLGSDYDDAKELALSIVSSYYASGVSGDIRDYFRSQLNCN